MGVVEVEHNQNWEGRLIWHTHVQFLCADKSAAVFCLAVPLHHILLQLQSLTQQLTCLQRSIVPLSVGLHELAHITQRVLSHEGLRQPKSDSHSSA